MPIIFYSMGSACGFCVKAESMLKPQIDSGEVVKKSASEAGGKFNGFPAFESTETGKTHTGLPQSYEQLAKKLGHAEHYSHSQGKGHHNPYNYNAMPVRAPADECSPCIPPFSLDGGGNLVKPPGMSHKQCVSARKKCPGCDQGSDPCAHAPKPKPPSGPDPNLAASHCKYNPNPNQGVDQCCAKYCNKDQQCIADCVQIVQGHEGGGGGHGGGGGQGGGGNTRTCSSFPGCGQHGGSITLDGGECVWDRWTIF